MTLSGHGEGRPAGLDLTADAHYHEQQQPKLSVDDSFHIQAGEIAISEISHIEAPTSVAFY